MNTHERKDSKVQRHGLPTCTCSSAGIIWEGTKKSLMPNLKEMSYEDRLKKLTIRNLEKYLQKFKAALLEFRLGVHNTSLVHCQEDKYFFFDLLYPHFKSNHYITKTGTKKM